MLAMARTQSHEWFRFTLRPQQFNRGASPGFMGVAHRRQNTIRQYAAAEFGVTFHRVLEVENRIAFKLNLPFEQLRTELSRTTP